MLKQFGQIPPLAKTHWAHGPQHLRLGYDVVVAVYLYIFAMYRFYMPMLGHMLGCQLWLYSHAVAILAQHKIYVGFPCSLDLVSSDLV